MRVEKKGGSQYCSMSILTTQKVTGHFAHCWTIPDTHHLQQEKFNLAHGFTVSVHGQLAPPWQKVMVEWGCLVQGIQEEKHRERGLARDTSSKGEFPRPHFLTMHHYGNQWVSPLRWTAPPWCNHPSRGPLIQGVDNQAQSAQRSIWIPRMKNHARHRPRCSTEKMLPIS